ncbi:MAG: histidinol dehydrogenase [Verrucomicrobia bacterium]|nr:histidinol dehydrogenase [Verrucomicrobiota bacterium]
MICIDARTDESGLRFLNRRYSPPAALIEVVSSILASVKSKGDQAVAEFTSRFDKNSMLPGEFRVQRPEIQEALGLVNPEFVQALKASHANVVEFALRSRRTDWNSTNNEGAQAGERYDPFERVGVYIPSGTAPLVSTAIMTVSLAQTVGVPEIVVTSPANSEKRLNITLLTALELAGATEIYKIGGAQAIAALAYGTESIRPVAKIFGPGNAYVIEAKRQVFGYTGIDLLPGPSEILVVADRTANPSWVAADLLAQAEHGKGSVMALVAFDPLFQEQVQQAIEFQIQSLRRSSFLKEVLADNAYFILASDRKQAVRIVNVFAPEHLSLVVEDAIDLASQITAAGAIFIGGYSPVAAGDFLAGPSHELPTGGATKSFSGLTVDQFQRRTSIIQFDPESLKRSAATLLSFGEMELLDAHSRSISIRLDG